MSIGGADFQESFILMFSPVISLILVFSLAGTVLLAIIRVVVMSLAPRARPYFDDLGGTSERR